MHEPTVIIADDHPIFRKGLRDVIENSARFRVLGEASDGASALALIMEEIPDVAILDIEMPGMSGIDILRKVSEAGLHVSSLILTMYDDEDMFNEAMDAGAMGYILKDSAILEIVKGLSKVARGEIFVSAAMTSAALRGKTEAHPQLRKRLGLHLLTPAEKRVLQLIAEDKTTKEISETLSVSPRTVDNHRAHICSKLKITGVYALIKFAVRYKALLD
ncbi:MAG: response regulator transcription factor [Bacteroidia bacterium]|nr:response regulator transcription factor [Bacteroidia bacterium]